ncbi:MAG: hypothetical protein QXF85_00445 [Candidatus Micrarchaeaceae archaeon]
MAAKRIDKKGSMAIKNKSVIANPKRFYTFLIIIVIAIAAIAYALIPRSSVLFVSSGKSVQLKPGEAMLMKMQNSSVFAMLVYKSNSTGAIVYISQLPIPASYASKFVLLKGENAGVNVSVNATGNADLNVRLSSSNATSVELLLTPLSSILGIKVSKEVTLVGPYTISTAGGLKVITISTTSSTSTTTSTINQTAALLESALNYANNKTNEGVLMNKYKALYNKDTVCNESIYNATYEHYYSTEPSGVSSFDNISKLIPINVTVHAAIKSGAFVFVNYTPTFRNGSRGGPMLSLLLNMSPGAVAHVANATYEGILTYATYAEINSTYAFQSSINNYCGAYIVPPS